MKQENPLITKVRGEIVNKKQQKEGVPPDVREMLEEVFNHNDNVVSRADKIGIEWVSQQLKDAGYNYGTAKLRTIAVSMGRKSWGTK